MAIFFAIFGFVLNRTVFAGGATDSKFATRYNAAQVQTTMAALPERPFLSRAAGNLDQVRALLRKYWPCPKVPAIASSRTITLPRSMVRTGHPTISSPS